MSNCKYCGQTIYWGSVDGKPRPFNDEGLTQQHDCRSQQKPQPQQQRPAPAAQQQAKAPEQKFSGMKQWAKFETEWMDPVSGLKRVAGVTMEFPAEDSSQDCLAKAQFQVTAFVAKCVPEGERKKAQ